MNEREEFLHYFRPVFIKMVDRLETMTESEVLDGLVEVRAARKAYKEEFDRRIEAMIQAGPRPRVEQGGRDIREALLDLVSTQPFLDSLKKMRLKAGAKPRSGSGISPFDSLENALNDRLESLRKSPGRDS